MWRKYELGEALRARLSTHLARFSRRQAEGEGLRAAAVALTLLPGANGEPAFLLTRRAGNLNHHGGQFALPGGRLDVGESAVDAALRELEEELGVRLDGGSVLGLLDDVTTRSGFLITPVVLWAEHVTALRPNPDEVALVYRVPVQDLYRAGVPAVRASPDTGKPLLSLPLLGTHIHSPTAVMVFQMREVAFEGRDTRVDDYDEPRFAWK
jgi:8-oxo-dGTP pyrophosphatase MutT (NUDIX family)